MTSDSATKFAAGPSMVGYLYQVRVALMWSLSRLPVDTDFAVSVETLDDVTFAARDGTPKEVLQVKHHCNHEANLTDASPDLWKSLRIWFELHATQKIPKGAALHLMTTAAAPEGSVASRLGINDRDVNTALQALEATAQSSQSAANSAAYKVFMKASPDVRRAIIDDVVVLDSALPIADIDGEMQRLVFSAVERRHLGAFLERLEGWWFRRVLKQLGTQNDRILADEIETQMNDLREQFKQDSLPIDEDLLSTALDEAFGAAHTNSIFVRQIELARAGRERIAAAIRDYYRAFEQRSRWMRDDLLLLGELDNYERRLVEEWELEFQRVRDEIGSQATEEMKQRAARIVLGWAEQFIMPIRPRVTEPFVTRGSFHILADQLQVGWHPEFKARLAHLLQTTGVAQ